MSSSRINEGVRKKQLETATLPDMKLTSPDRVKQEQKQRGDVGRSQKRNDEDLKIKRREHKLR